MRVGVRGTVMSMRKLKLRSGFTLVEIAIVMIVIGLLMSGFIRFMGVFAAQKEITEMEDTYEVVKGALSDFRYADPDPDDADPTEINARYPCPASPSAPRGDVAFGVEDCTTNNGVVEVIGTGGRPVLIGTVPTTTLGISSAHMLDPYDNRLTYAVTTEVPPLGALSVPGVAGGITIDPTVSGTPITNAKFALLSHGRDGAGSYTAAGVASATVCRVGQTADSENCDYDAQFSEIQLVRADTAAFYDDTVAFSLSNNAVNAVCDAGEYVASITNGIPDCIVLADVIAGFLANKTCSGTDKVSGFDGSGDIVCTADEEGGGGGSEPPPPSYASCSGTTYGICTIRSAPHGGTSGQSCDRGGCSYTCNNGAWRMNYNNCKGSR